MCGVPGPDLAAHVDPGAVRQAAVEDRHVRAERRDPAGRLLGQARLADDHDVALALEELPDPAAHDLVVVEQEHPDGFGGRRGVGHGPHRRRPGAREDGLIALRSRDLGPCRPRGTRRTVGDVPATRSPRCAPDRPGSSVPPLPPRCGHERPVDVDRRCGSRTRSLRSVVELACLAPSIHNTQPWTWRYRDGPPRAARRRTRRLPAADPTGRSLVISCGAALHHARVAARALGLGPEVERLPVGPAPPCWRRCVWSGRRPSPTAVTDLRCLEERHTDRRRFTSWPVPGRAARAAGRGGP